MTDTLRSSVIYMDVTDIAEKNKDGYWVCKLVGNKRLDFNDASKSKLLYRVDMNTQNCLSKSEYYAPFALFRLNDDWKVGDINLAAQVLFESIARDCFE